jgi:isoprenylcysteine carboxyl methyltransferase (ICMT) family protein YpbQ
MEYGKRNTLVLVLFHTLFYVACLGESLLLQKRANDFTTFGMMLFIFSMAILAIVIYHLRDMWTVKLIIAPQQKVNRSFIFKYFRHPNYFLNVVPELISIAFICQAWYTLTIGLPFYLIPLTIRIVQEEKIMRKHFNDY